MEQQNNTSSASCGDSSLYRSRSSYEQNTDEENEPNTDEENEPNTDEENEQNTNEENEQNTDEEYREEDSQNKDMSDICDSGNVAGAVHRSFSPGKYSPSPNSSPVFSRRQVASWGYGDQIPFPAESQAWGKHTVQHKVHLCTANLNSSPSPLKRKSIHSTPLESPRSRSQIVSQRKVQSAVAFSDISSDSLCVKQKISSSRAEKSRQLSKETAAFTSIESLKQLLQENLSVIVLFVVLVMTGVFAFIHIGTGPQHEKCDDLLLKPNQILEDFLQAFDELNSSFPAQTSTFWKVLRSGTRSIIVQEIPVQPAVFIIAVPKDAQQTAVCVVRRYADIVTEAFKGRQPIEFTHHLRTADTPDHIKHIIDDTLNLGFSEGSRVAIIHELDKLHGKSAMMFHGYCDNENAPFTQVVIMFTLFVDAVNEETDDLVEKKLSQVWGKYLDSDTLFPLLSRIGNRNAFVRQENREVLETNGCF